MRVDNKKLSKENSLQNKDAEISSITLKDQFFMGDFKKYYKYNIFPYLFFIQIFLVLTTTAIVNITLLI